MSEKKEQEVTKIKITDFIRPLSSYHTLAVDWLWKHRVPRGMLTLLAGRPGTGKSTLTHSIAARLSTGLCWPDNPDVRIPVADTILITQEDDIQRVIHPRLDIMRADLRRVHIWTKVPNPRTGKLERFNLVDHMDFLRTFLKTQKDVKLVVFDTIESFIGNINTHKNADVRQVLDPLCEIAADTNVAILGVTHLNKASRENRSALDRVMGSTGYTGAARMVWLLAKDPDEKELVKMVQVKSNISGDPGGLAYKIQKLIVTDINGKDTETTQIGFQQGVIFEDADAVVQADARTKEVVDHVGDWLKQFLLSGPKELSTIKRAATEAGHSINTLYKKRGKLGVVKFTSQSPNGYITWWKLPKSRKVE